MVSSPFWEKTLLHHFDRSGHFGLKLVHSPVELYPNGELDKATSTHEIVVFVTRPGNIITVMGGIYEVELKKVDGVWLIDHLVGKLTNPNDLLQPGPIYDVLLPIYQAMGLVE